MSRVDAHHHVWTLSRGDYGWLEPTAALAPIYRDFDLAELRPLLAAAGIDATLLVQAAPTLAETRFLLDIARESGGLVRGVVGWADLGAADAVETLGPLARDPLLKSVRPMLQDLADPEWITRPDVQPALAALPPQRPAPSFVIRPLHSPNDSRRVGLVWRRGYPKAQELALLGDLIINNPPVGTRSILKREAAVRVRS